MTPRALAFLAALQKSDPSGMFAIDEAHVAFDVFLTPEQLDDALAASAS